jgi:hypothetical protein
LALDASIQQQAGRSGASEQPCESAVHLVWATTAGIAEIISAASTTAIARLRRFFRMPS